MRLATTAAISAPAPDAREYVLFLSANRSLGMISLMLCPTALIRRQPGSLRLFSALTHDPETFADFTDECLGLLEGGEMSALG